MIYANSEMTGHAGKPPPGPAPEPEIDLERLVTSQRAVIRKHRVSWPLRARWAAFWPWGDPQGDKRLAGPLNIH